jgi:hypothetical protein
LRATRQVLSQALENLRITTRDKELQTGEVAIDPLGLPAPVAAVIVKRVLVAHISPFFI